MKVNCQYCTKNFKGKLAEPFYKFHVGRVICPHCNKENKRYLSEFDLLLYFTFICIICSAVVICYALFFELLFLNNLWLSLGLSTITLAVAFYLSDYSAKYIYSKAPFKAPWKTHDFKQQREEVTRRLNQQFILFIVISILIGTQKELFIIYLTLMFAMIVLNLIKAVLAFRNEKAIIEQK